MLLAQTFQCKLSVLYESGKNLFLLLLILEYVDMICTRTADREKTHTHTHTHPNYWKFPVACVCARSGWFPLWHWPFVLRLNLHIVDYCVSVDSKTLYYKLIPTNIQYTLYSIFRSLCMIFYVFYYYMWCDAMPYNIVAIRMHGMGEDMCWNWIESNF